MCYLHEEVWEVVGQIQGWRATHEAKVFLSKQQTTRYSASVEDLDTLSCVLHFQEIKASPRNIHHPVVERRTNLHRTWATLQDNTGWSTTSSSLPNTWDKHLARSFIDDEGCQMYGLHRTRLTRQRQ